MIPPEFEGRLVQYCCGECGHRDTALWSEHQAHYEAHREIRRTPERGAVSTTHDLGSGITVDVLTKEESRIEPGCGHPEFGGMCNQPSYHRFMIHGEHPVYRCNLHAESFAARQVRAALQLGGSKP